MTRAGVLTVLLAAGCGGPSPRPAAIGFQGPDGAAVTIDSLPVTRIVSTMQSATEWLVALGAASTLVARTDFDRQTELAALPSVGGGLEASAEVIAALDPDVVLGWRIPASAALAHTLGPFGIPVIAVEATDTAEAFQQLATLARLVGREARGAALADSLRTALAALQVRYCPDRAAAESAMVVLWAEPPMTAGGGTWMGELMAAACLTNAFADLALPWPPSVSMEAIAQRQPRWILTSVAGNAGVQRARLQSLAGWRDLDAVRAGRIIEIDGDLFARLGPRMAEWVEAVAQAKGAFGDGQAPTAGH